MGSHATYLGLTALWEAIVCPKDRHSKWHVQDCMFGKCENCGVDNLTLCLDEEEGTSFVVICWKHFSMEKVVTKKGPREKKIMHMEINAKELLLTFTSKL